MTGWGGALSSPRPLQPPWTKGTVSQPRLPCRRRRPERNIQISPRTLPPPPVPPPSKAAPSPLAPSSPSAPGVEQTAGSLIYTTPHGPSGRAGLLQQPPALGRGGSGGGGLPVNALPSPPSSARAGGGLALRGVVARCGPPLVGSAGPSVSARRLPLQRGGLLLKTRVLTPTQHPEGRVAPPASAGRRGSPWREPHQKLRNFSRPPLLFLHFSLPHSPPSNSKLPLLGRRKGSRPGWRRGGGGSRELGSGRLRGGNRRWGPWG